MMAILSIIFFIITVIFFICYIRNAWKNWYRPGRVTSLEYETKYIRDILKIHLERFNKLEGMIDKEYK